MLNKKGLTKWLAVLFLSLCVANSTFIKPLYAYQTHQVIEPGKVKINSLLKEVSPKTYGNDVFRDVSVSGTGGSYQITGQVSTKYSKYGYSLDEGHVEYTKKWVSINKNQHQGAWIPFQITINIAKEQLPYSGMLNLLLFVDNQEKEALYIPVEYFDPN